MAGQDQSVNLGGMLTDIGGTIGSMGAPMGEVFGDAIRQANRPVGDMEDPAHLTALAQWAQRNGDPESARMYTVQAREAQDKVDEQATVQFAADTMEMDTSADMAASGNAAGLEQVIQQLTAQRDAARDSGSMDQLRIAQNALDNAIQARSATAQKKVQNEIQALTMIDQTLANESLDTDVRSGVESTRVKLLSDPKVREGYNAMLLEKWRIQDTERSMVAQQYSDENREALNTAITENDQGTIDRLIADAPNARAADAMRSMTDTITTANENSAKALSLKEEAAETVDIQSMTEIVDALPAGVDAQSREALRVLETTAGKRGSDGKFPTSVHATAYVNALRNFRKTVANANAQIGQQEYARTVAEEARTAAKIEELEIDNQTYYPSASEVMSQAKVMAAEAEDYVRKDGKQVLNTDAYIADARSQLRTIRRRQNNAQLANLRGEVPAEGAEERTYTDAEEQLIARGMQTGASREAVIAHINANDGWDAASEFETPAPAPETAESATLPGPVTLNETTPVSQRGLQTGASNIYSGSAVPGIFDAVAQFPNKVGNAVVGMFDGVVDPAEARRKLEENQFKGVN